MSGNYFCDVCCVN